MIEDEEPDDDAEELESVDTSYDESGASSPTMPALLSGSNAPSPKSGNKPVNSPKIGMCNALADDTGHPEQLEFHYPDHVGPVYQCIDLCE